MATCPATNSSLLSAEADTLSKVVASKLGIAAASSASVAASLLGAEGKVMAIILRSTCVAGSSGKGCSAQPLVALHAALQRDAGVPRQVGVLPSLWAQPDVCELVDARAKHLGHGARRHGEHYQRAARSLRVGATGREQLPQLAQRQALDVLLADQLLHHLLQRGQVAQRRSEHGIQELVRRLGGVLHLRVQLVGRLHHRIAHRLLAGEHQRQDGAHGVVGALHFELARIYQQCDGLRDITDGRRRQQSLHLRERTLQLLPEGHRRFKRRDQRAHALQAAVWLHQLAVLAAPALLLVGHRLRLLDVRRLRALHPVGETVAGLGRGIVVAAPTAAAAVRVGGFLETELLSKLLLRLLLRWRHLRQLLLVLVQCSLKGRHHQRGAEGVVAEQLVEQGHRALAHDGRLVG
eukprot:scaffold2805_cov202-Prasinococcus_capsulatus_cf.AAC.3